MKFIYLFISCNDLREGGDAGIGACATGACATGAFSWIITVLCSESGFNAPYSAFPAILPAPAARAVPCKTYKDVKTKLLVFDTQMQLISL